MGDKKILNNDYWSFDLLRKYQYIFGSLFNNLIVQRTANSVVTQIINVPIDYAEKEKMLTRVTQDPGINKQTAIILPRMSYFMDGMTYAADRKSTTMGKYVFSTATNTLNWQYKEIPFDFHFSLYLYVKNIEDANKMIEQIMPFFTPAYTVRALLIPNRPSLDIPIYFRDITHTDTDSEDFKDRSIHVWQLMFTLKAYLWGPVQTKGIIETIDVSVYYGDGPNFPEVNNNAFGISNNLVTPASSLAGELDETIYIQPGVDVSGNPTTLLANSIPLANITYNMPYGIISVVNSTPASN